jgi:cytochrome c biogenesis protein CcmG/thiol:disulfide interchange protein DsbE
LNVAKISPLLVVPPLIFAALAGLFWGGLMRENAGELPSQFIGQPAPNLPTEATLQALSDQGYRVAGVNFRDQADDAASYLADEGNPFFATGFDLRGRVAIDWGVTAPPETFIVGPDGKVLSRFIGPLIGSDYEQRFLPMLEAAAAE